MAVSDITVSPSVGANASVDIRTIQKLGLDQIQPLYEDRQWERFVGAQVFCSCAVAAWFRLGRELNHAKRLF
jgi:hypothetical protein